MQRRVKKAAVIATALVTAVLVSPAGSKPSVTFFLHIDQSNPQSPPVTTLSTEDRKDTGNGIGLVFSGLPNEVLQATGLAEPHTMSFTSVVDGTFPLRVRPGSSITGVIAMRCPEYGTDPNNAISVGGGVATLHLELLGKTRSGNSVTIGTQSIDFVVTPAREVYPLDVDMTVELQSATPLTSITLETLVDGPSLLTGSFELENPASFIRIPTK